MQSLNLPTRNDPISKILLFILLAAALWANLATFEQPAQAQADPTFIFQPSDPQPTPALPTAPAEQPALVFAAPTATPLGWLDQQLATAGAAGDSFAQSQADQLAVEQAAAQAQYLENVGAQASHSPRGDSTEPPPSQTGPILYPAAGDTPAYIIAPAAPPAPAAPAAPQMAVAVPATSAEQQAIIGARASNSCAPGEVFYPRSGCHAPGSGGEMPGAVGEP